MIKNGKATIDLSLKVKALEMRIAVLERVCKRFTRKKRDYTAEERAAIRARLLSDQDAARKRREPDATGKPVNTKAETTKRAIMVEKPKKKSQTTDLLKVTQSSSQEAAK